MNLIIVRHGQVPDDSDSNLTSLGREQVKMLAEKLKGSKIDKIYSSDLKRAVETAEIISRYPNKEVKFSKMIREVEREIISMPKEKWLNKDNEHRLKEIKAFLKDLEKKHKGETVLLIGHGQLNRVVIGLLTDMEMHKLYKIQKRHACINKLSLVDYKGEKLYRIITLNNTEHLPESHVTVLNGAQLEDYKAIF